MSNASPDQRPDYDDLITRLERRMDETREFIRQSHEQDAEAAKRRSTAPMLDRDWEPAGWQLMAAGVAIGATLMAVCYVVASLLQQNVCR